MTSDKQMRRDEMRLGEMRSLVEIAGGDRWRRSLREIAGDEMRSD